MRLSFPQLLGKVIFDSHLFDRVQLAFEPVDVVLFVGQNFFQQFARAVVFTSTQV